MREAKYAQGENKSVAGKRRRNAADERAKGGANTQGRAMKRPEKKVSPLLKVISRCSLEVGARRPLWRSSGQGTACNGGRTVRSARKMKLLRRARRLLSKVKRALTRTKTQAWPDSGREKRKRRGGKLRPLRDGARQLPLALNERKQARKKSGAHARKTGKERGSGRREREEPGELAYRRNTESAQPLFWRKSPRQRMQKKEHEEEKRRG